MLVRSCNTSGQRVDALEHVVTMSKLKMRIGLCEKGKHHVLFAFVATIVLALTFGGCGSKDTKAQKLKVVDYIVPLSEKVVPWAQFPARISAIQYSNVTARVSGIIEKAPLLEGMLVTEGDVLFEIDSRPFAAEVKVREAEVAKGRAELARASADFARREKLKGTSALSAADYEQSLALLQQARANLEAAIAQKELAALNLEWTQVKAPISGKVGRKLVTEGNMINGGTSTTPTALTTIVSTNPMHALAVLPEQAFVRQIQQGSYMISQDRKLPCKVLVPNVEGFERWGDVDFIDNKIDPTTGTVEIRCVVDNSDHRLASGLSVQIRIPKSDQFEALLVPEMAIGTDQGSKYLVIVDSDGTVARRQVTLGEQFGPLRAILNGIAKHDKVLVSGTQMARIGEKVEARQITVSEQDISLMKALSAPPQQLLPTSTALATPRPPSAG